MKRKKYEMYSMTFDSFARDLDEIPDEELSGHHFEVEEKLLVEEAKLSCMKAMLLCLDREQRLIFILRELFEFPDSIGSEVMEISKENFRVKLHRAKQQLYNFMDNKCGLINKKNPCRCARKTASYIKLGFVDPVRIPDYSLPLFRYKPYHLFRGKVYHDSGPNLTSNSAAKFTR